MKWFSDNWDKVLTVVAAAIVGFFTAIFTVQSRLSDLQRDLAKVQTTLDGAVVPKMQALDTMSVRLGDFSRELSDLQKQNMLSIQTNNYLQLLLTEERKRTANDLREILNDEAARSKKVAP